MNAIGTQLRDPINSGLIHKWTPPRNSGGIPEVSIRFSLSVENEQADTGRDCRTRLARPDSQARTRTEKYSFFRVQLTTCRIGSRTRLIHTLAICVTLHTYIHTFCHERTKGNKILFFHPFSRLKYRRIFSEVYAWRKFGPLGD